jgi:spermidine/putrescine transport system permease protein
LDEDQGKLGAAAGEPAVERAPEHWRDRKDAFFGLLGPGTIWLTLFFTLPLALVWAYSFSESDRFGDPTFVLTIENYVRAFEWVHVGIFWKSIWIAAVVTALCVAIGFPVAFGIAFAPERWKTPLLVLVILPFWTNLLVRTYGWITVLRTHGHVNNALEWAHGQAGTALAALGAPGALGSFEPLELLYNEGAVIVALVHLHLPFLVLPLYATLERLDRTLMEASLDLGAGHWRTARAIVVPLAKPGLATGALLVFILCLGNFVAADLLGGADAVMIGNLIAQQFGAARDWPFGAALSLLLLYATFLILWLKAADGRRRKATP